MAFTTQPTILQAVLQQIIADSPHKQKLAQAAYSCAWKTIMPILIQKRTMCTFMKGKKFFVQLSSAPLKKELQINKHKILQKLQAAVQAHMLEDIVFL